MSFPALACIDFFLFQIGRRGPPPLEDDLHVTISEIIAGPHIPKAERTVQQSTAHRKIRKHKFKLKMITNPVTKEQEHAITFHNLIVPNQSSVEGIIMYFHKESHGDGARKLEEKIHQYYTGG